MITWFVWLTSTFGDEAGKSRIQISCGRGRGESRLHNSPGARVKKGVRLERKDLMARKSYAGALKPNFEGENPTFLQCKRMRS